MTECLGREPVQLEIRSGCGKPYMSFQDFKGFVECRVRICVRCNQCSPKMAEDVRLEPFS